jgi:hypothetical protein
VRGERLGRKFRTPPLRANLPKGPEKDETGSESR